MAVHPQQELDVRQRAPPTAHERQQGGKEMMEAIKWAAARRGKEDGVGGSEGGGDGRNQGDMRKQGPVKSLQGRCLSVCATWPGVDPESYPARQPATA